MGAARAARPGSRSVQPWAGEVRYAPTGSDQGTFLLREVQVLPILMLYSFILGGRGTETGRWK